MNTVVDIADQALAKGLVAKLKAKHHKDLLEIAIEACPAGPVTCQQLYDALESQKDDMLDVEQLRIWDKYSAACHMSYFVNRCRGAVIATLDGTTVEQRPTGKKKAAVVEAPVEQVAPVADEVTADIEAALA
jgi:hypothetical protein